MPVQFLLDSGEGAEKDDIRVQNSEPAHVFEGAAPAFKGRHNKNGDATVFAHACAIISCRLKDTGLIEMATGQKTVFTQIAGSILCGRKDDLVNKTGLVRTGECKEVLQIGCVVNGNEEKIAWLTARLRSRHSGDDLTAGRNKG